MKKKSRNKDWPSDFQIKMQEKAQRKHDKNNFEGSKVEIPQ